MLGSRSRSGLLIATVGALACTPDPTPEQDEDSGSSDASTQSGTETETGETGDGDGDPGTLLETRSLTHRFGERQLAPFQETEPCVQWTLDNDSPLYVQIVTLANLGYYHHSNWFVVPEDEFPGDDGYFQCSSRGFSEFSAAMVGTVLYAQSTQSFVETQRTLDGAVIKIPARHKVVADVHMLNVGPDTVSTDMFMTLDMIHPADVDLVLTPFRLSYLDLDIPANSQAHFTGFCDDFGQRYADATGHPMDMKLHYVLPHYHYLGNYFDLSFDGDSAYRLDGFNGEANGKMFDPPLDLTGVEGIRYTCGYDNWRDVDVGWGIGDQEMCVALGFAESDVLIDVSVIAGTVAAGEQDGILQYQAVCGVLTLPKNDNQGPPTDEEKNGPWNIPDSGDPGIPPIPECVDHDPGVAPVLPPTLANVNAAVFEASCTFSACHGVSQAAGLDLHAPNLLAELLDHEVLGNPGMALVEPGDPDNSWLYQVLSSCAPDNGSGGVASHMPLNAPVLLGDTTVALVREWIAAGANP